jgi:SET and MYND domain-containing protein
MSAPDADAVAGVLPGGKVELRTGPSAHGGRRLFVRAPIKAGDEILSLNPYAAVLNDANLTTRCDHTFGTSEGSLLRCARSKVARYGSREAQAAAWKRGYKEECASLVKCAPRVPPPTVRLAARILWRRAREGRSRDGGSTDDDDEMLEDGVKAATALGLGDGFDALDALDASWDALPDARKAQLAHAATLTSAFFAGTLKGGVGASIDDTATGPDPRDIARLLGKISCNAHTVCDEELNPVGVAVYPAAAMVNHADSPSAAQSFKGRRITLRATRDLKPGDEVTMAYVELLATRQERRAALWRGYRFDLDGGNMDTYCPHLSEIDPATAMKGTTRTRLPGGAVLVDHGEGSESPPWRTGAADPYLCAVAASDANSSAGVLHGGLEVITRAPTVDDDDSDDDEVPEEVDYSGGLGTLRGAGGFGRTLAPESKKSSSFIKSMHEEKRLYKHLKKSGRGGAYGPCRGDNSRLEVHVWGTLGGADREHTALFAAECAQLLAKAECCLADPSLDEVTKVTNALEPLTRASSLMNGGEDACALGPIHLLRVRVLDAMQRSAVAAGDFESARDAAYAVLPAFRLAYPPCHPPLGLHLALLAKIEAHLVDLPAAVQFAREAISCLNVSHGQNARVVRMMETLLGESEAELQYDEYNRRSGNQDAAGENEGYLEAYE